ncbi:unnamed protein product [Meganyctiphanes norvegica]|uniref:Ig-like domain-containing protein n=1 Tax=Meganyctiphanes norvegica TaxID=48144 RepID=A0AAV2PYA4_MEGNR
MTGSTIPKQLYHNTYSKTLLLSVKMVKTTVDPVKMRSDSEKMTDSTNKNKGDLALTTDLSDTTFTVKRKIKESVLRRAKQIFIDCARNILLVYILLCYLPCAHANYNSYVVNPEFGERPKDLNITTFAGQTGRLPCTVKHLQGKVVSWIRGRDLQVLSTGRVTFSTDLRISVLPGTKGRKQRATRDTRNASIQWQGGKVKIWRKGHRRKKRQVDQSILNANLSTSSIIQLFDINETKSIHHLSKRTNHIIAHPKDKRYVKDLDTFDDYGFRERDTDPFWDYDIDSSTRRKYNRKFLKTYSRLQDHKPHQDFSQNRKFLMDYRLQDQRSHHGDSSHHHLQHRKQPKHYSDYGGTFTIVEDDLHQKPTNIVTPYTGVPKSGRSHHIRAFYPQDFGNSPITPTLQQDTPIAIYPQTYYTQDGSRKEQTSSPNYVPGVWEPEDYTLQIKFIEPGDAGLYICQINTDPKMFQNIYVKVINMKAEIVGSSELYVKAGTPVTLTCRVNHGSTMPGFIFWYRDNSLVDYDHSGGRVQVHTGSDGTSQLHLTKASPTDSANYTCWPSGGAKASVSLNVIQDERQAAMQQGNGAISSCSSSPTWVMLLPISLCLVLMLGSHAPYYLLLSCVGLLAAVITRLQEMIHQQPPAKEHNWFNTQPHKDLAHKKHIVTYISALCGVILIYVVYIYFLPFTTYTKHSPFIHLCILFLFIVLLFSSSLTFLKCASVSSSCVLNRTTISAPGCVMKIPSPGFVMWSMSSLVFYCGSQILLGFM